MANLTRLFKLLSELSYITEKGYLVFWATLTIISEGKPSQKIISFRKKSQKKEGIWLILNFLLDEPPSFKGLKMLPKGWLSRKFSL